MQKRAYSTKSRACILKYLQENSAVAVSVNDIVAFIEKQGITANVTTVYRFLNQLTEEKQVIKFTDESGQKAVFQLASSEKECHKHIHIKCVSCGKIHHLDCDFMDEIKNHLKTEHGFDLLCEQSVLYGICADCKK